MMCVMERPELIQEVVNAVRFAAFTRWPEFVLGLQFRRRTGYRLNLREPQTFNEKLQWLKLYWFDPRATICADKYSVRDYVKSKGLDHILNELYGVYEDVESIDFEELPDKFAMKVTHGCGQNLLCTDKKALDWENEKKRFKKWLRRNHYYRSLEWVYRDIKPRIIVERLIEAKDGRPPKDYKFFCFNGEPKCLFVASDRGKGTTKFDFYDLEWNRLGVTNYYPNSPGMLPKPDRLEDMIDCARVIPEGFPHVRVDFYLEDGRVIFGECTFFHFSGNQPFDPVEFDYVMGSYLQLPR